MIANILRVLWCGGCVALLVWALSSEPGTEAHVAFGWAMIALTFPIGLFGLFIVGGVSYLAIAFTSHGSSSPLLFWSVMTALGYVQWFVLIPEIVRRRRALAREGR